MRPALILAQVLSAISICWAQSPKPQARLEAEYYVAAYAQHYRVAEGRFRSEPPDLLVLDIDLSTGQEAFADLSSTNPFDTDAPNRPVPLFYVPLAVTPHNRDVENSIKLRGLEDRPSRAGKRIADYYASIHDEIKTTKRVLLYTNLVQVREDLGEFIDLCRKEEIISPNRAPGPALMEKVRKLIPAFGALNLFDRHILELFFDNPTARFCCVLGDRNEIDVPFELLPTHGTIDGNKIRLTRNLSETFLLGPLFFPWAKRLADSKTREQAISEIRDTFSDFLDLTISCDFSRCFGVGAMDALLHLSVPLPNTEQQNSLKSEALKQVEILNTALEAKVSRCPSVAEYLSKPLRDQVETAPESSRKAGTKAFDFIRKEYG